MNGSSGLEDTRERPFSISEVGGCWVDEEWADGEGEGDLDRERKEKESDEFDEREPWCLC